MKMKVTFLMFVAGEMAIEILGRQNPARKIRALCKVEVEVVTYKYQRDRFGVKIDTDLGCSRVRRVNASDSQIASPINSI